MSTFSIPLFYSNLVVKLGLHHFIVHRNQSLSITLIALAPLPALTPLPLSLSLTLIATFEPLLLHKLSALLHLVRALHTSSSAGFDNIRQSSLALLSYYFCYWAQQQF
ncbi:hypothetical protein Sjap_013067 [Stephania japonica]|uniref:Uncharacterized protein n=1 Tax=Stephania japonica TaxID=461633 RepID=A0AAP0IYF5_9MAGN